MKKNIALYVSALYTHVMIYFVIKTRERQTTLLTMTTMTATKKKMDTRISSHFLKNEENKTAA